jgi:sugar phosphate isomerase/epimerase
MDISGSKYFGINYDGANLHRSGYVETKDNVSQWISGENKNSENEADVLRERGIFSRVVHFHAKDLDKNRSCTALGKGEVLVRECIGILKEGGYDGVVSLETEGGMPFEAAAKLAKESYEFMCLCCDS